MRWKKPDGKWSNEMRKKEATTITMVHSLDRQQPVNEPLRVHLKLFSVLNSTIHVCLFPMHCVGISENGIGAMQY